MPTPGYSGHTSIFIKPISYLNAEKIKAEEAKLSNPEEEKSEMPESFRNALNIETPDPTEVKKYKILINYFYFIFLVTLHSWL